MYCLVHCVWGAYFICILHILGVPCILCGDMYVWNISLTLLKQTQGTQTGEYILWTRYFECTWYIWYPDIFYIFNIYVMYIWCLLGCWCVWWTVYILGILGKEHIIYTHVYKVCDLHSMRIHEFWKIYKIYVGKFSDTK